MTEQVSVDWSDGNYHKVTTSITMVDWYQKWLLVEILAPLRVDWMRSNNYPLANRFSSKHITSKHRETTG